MSIRSDLALEAADNFLINHDLPQGVSIRRYLRGSFKVCECVISSPAAAKKIGKPVGRYVTFETEKPMDGSGTNPSRDILSIGEELSRLIGDCRRVLVAGLGNESVTPDSLGPLTASRVIATRHIQSEGLFERSVSVLTPGVMGKTGFEALELIRSAAKVSGAEAVLVIDALACSGVSKLGCALQICDSGISPGSGVMNSRAEISKRTLGVKCIALGVPTMADSKELGLMVTPKSIDKLICHTSRLISGGINVCLHPELSISEIEILSE